LEAKRQINKSQVKLFRIFLTGLGFLDRMTGLSSLVEGDLFFIAALATNKN
jgi:hypothetical protein